MPQSQSGRIRDGRKRQVRNAVGKVLAANYKCPGPRTRERCTAQKKHGVLQLWAPGTSQTRLSCPTTSSKEKLTTEISPKSTGKLKTASTWEDVLAGRNKAPKEVKIGSFTKSSSPTIRGRLMELPQQSRSILALRYQLYGEDS